MIRATPDAAVLSRWSGMAPEVAEEIGDVGGVGPRCLHEASREGASHNLFQYLEREKTKELALPALFPTAALSFHLHSHFVSVPSFVGPSDFQRVVYTTAYPFWVRCSL